MKSFVFFVSSGLKTDFESRCHGGPGDKCGPLVGRNLPEVVNNIVWVQQLIHKVTEWVSHGTPEQEGPPGPPVVSMC